MSSRKVLLVGWDAADWKVIEPLMAVGKMPNVRRLVESGAHGSIATLHPPLSPMLWTSIATGKRPFKHGIHGFSEPTPDGLGVQPVTNLSRTSKALWNILHQNDLRSIVVGWWPSHPAEPINGVMVSDHYHRARGPLETGKTHEDCWPLPLHTVHPPELAATLAALRVHPELLPPALVERFIPRAREIDQESDKRLALLLRTLAECMTIHAASMWLIENRPWDFFAVYFDAVDHFSHCFMRYHPPRQSWVSERDFELYSNVIAMAYQFHDHMLGALLEKAGADTTVILMSDHGFHPDHLRPTSIPDIPAGPAIEHRDFGILGMIGPGVNRGERIYGASLLDIAPTILTLFGLPIGEDMDGRPLSQAFHKPAAIEFIPSWEYVTGADGRHPSHALLDPVAAHEAMEQMIALGYVERPDENRALAVKKTIRELRYNLGEAYQDAGRHIEAHAIFSELAADPEARTNDSRFAVRLFVSCEALGLIDELRRIAAELVGQPVGNYLAARVLFAEKKHRDALPILERIAEAHPGHANLLLQIADLYLRLRRLRDAERTHHAVLTIDPDHPQAYLGLCRVALRRRNFRGAVHSALEALERVHHDPQGHFLLGLALAGMNQYPRAADAFRAAISLNPNFPDAHLRLADLLEHHLADPASAQEHRRQVRNMRRKQPANGNQTVTIDRHRKYAETPVPIRMTHMPEPAKILVVVSGLPRSGTSMLMQMLSAGGMPIVSDQLRVADEDNPRGYLEFEPVKDLPRDSKWLLKETGRAIKIVAPLLSALPPTLPCRILFCERDLDEVIDSQERMLIHRSQPVPTKERRTTLKQEYERTIARVKAMMARRPLAELLVIDHSSAIADPLIVAEQINTFLGGELDVRNMSSAVDGALHRNRALSRQ